MTDSDSDQGLTYAKADVRRWRRYLADERAEAQVYRDLAARKKGEEREILLGLAAAEQRHEQHWLQLLGPHAEPAPRPTLRQRLLGMLARVFGSVFVLALVQRSEGRSPYADDDDATSQMAADERIHGEVVRGLAERGRAQLSGNFRAGVFGVNDGLVSNLALVLGMAGTGASHTIVLSAGIAGLLAGALSMAAGEYVSVSGQRELLEASRPDEDAEEVLPDLDLDANELELVFRARGAEPDEAATRAKHVHQAIARYRARGGRRPYLGLAPSSSPDRQDHEEVGSGLAAAMWSFCFFATGAFIPVLPYLLGITGVVAVVVAAVLVGCALLLTGGIVGLLSGASPAWRGLRQLAIGYGAAAITYLLGLAFGASGLG